MIVWSAILSYGNQLLLKKVCFKIYSTYLRWFQTSPFFSNAAFTIHCNFCNFLFWGEKFVNEECLYHYLFHPKYQVIRTKHVSYDHDTQFNRISSLTVVLAQFWQVPTTTSLEFLTEPTTKMHALRRAVSQQNRKLSWSTAKWELALKEEKTRLVLRCWTSITKYYMLTGTQQTTS